MFMLSGEQHVVLAKDSCIPYAFDYFHIWVYTPIFLCVLQYLSVLYFVLLRDWLGEPEQEVSVAPISCRAPIQWPSTAITSQ